MDGEATICSSEGSTIDLNTLLDGNNDIGTWLETTASGQFDVVTGIFDGSGLAAGTYTFTYTVTALAPCLPDVADFTYSPDVITINDTRVEFVNTSMDADSYV